jgi:hypothetical protein
MNSESLLPWEKVTVKKIEDGTITVSHSDADITIPKKIIRGEIKVGDTLHITVMSDEERDVENTKIAKSILNTLFKNNGKGEKTAKE